MTVGGAGGGWAVTDEEEDVRAIAQEGPYDCGCACVQMVLREFAIPPPHSSQAEIAVLGGGTPFSVDSVRIVLSELARVNGARWRAGSVNLDSSTLLKLNQRGAWIALLWTGNKIGHFVVVLGAVVSDQRCELQILDPAKPGTKYRMTCDAFFATWTAFCVFREAA